MKWNKPWNVSVSFRIWMSYCVILVTSSSLRPSGKYIKLVVLRKRKYEIGLLSLKIWLMQFLYLLFPIYIRSKTTRVSRKKFKHRLFPIFCIMLANFWDCSLFSLNFWREISKLSVQVRVHRTSANQDNPDHQFWDL